ncbi:tetratricopeptide repeat protein, partial [Treponema pedis]|uniref:tetratricopeptide repeat protein n=1 Tax=Treponema pedis TaxID=409322 RepID=UPI000429E486
MGRLKLYIDYVKHQLQKRKEAKQNPQIDTEEIKREIWEADFSKKTQARFSEERGDGYEALFKTEDTGSFFSLELKRKHLYAWTLNNMFRYKDFVLDAEIELPKFKEDTVKNINDNGRTDNAGACAAGLLFRHISDKAFYALLISDKGWVRLDAVVNSTPMPIIGWTKPLCEILNSVFKVKIICAGTGITILINNTWLGKFDSDIVQAAGKIAFAGQNWETYPQVQFKLKSFKIVSEALLVETADSAANAPETISAESYINLATTYFGMGQYVAAIYQIKQAWKLREPVFQDYILAGRIYFAQHLLEEAEKEFLNASELEPDNVEVMQELASVYYRGNKIKELKTLFKKIPQTRIKSSVLLCSLKGHLLNAEGKHEEAAEMYGAAFNLEPTKGLLKYNEANELSLAGKREEAVQAYIKAGNLFLAGEEYKDMADVINALERLDPDNENTLSLAGKFYYAIENKTEALKNIKKLCAGKTKDSAIWYLYGLLLQAEDSEKCEDKNANEAIKAFKKAFKLEPEAGLYAFRLAEALYLNGEDCSDILAEAERLDTGNGWVYNLKGLCAMDKDDFSTAEAELEKARKILPDEIVILENYMEAVRLQGRLKECAPLFDIEAGTADLAAERNRARAFHIFANALFFDEEYEQADVWYQKAIKLRPADAELLTDKAENSLQIGFLNDADDLLVKALDMEPSERIYRLIAVVAAEKGDYARAEITLRTAMEELGESEELKADLENLYKQTKRKIN